MFEFVQDHLVTLLSLPTIAVVAILGFMIVKLVVKTVVKVLILGVLLVFAIFFWSTFQSHAQKFLVDRGIVHAAEK